MALGLAERRFFVAGLPDERLGQAVTLLVEGESLPPALEATLSVRIAQSLQRHQAPRRVVYIPCFIETATNKIDRRASLSSLEIEYA